MSSEMKNNDGILPTTDLCYFCVSCSHPIKTWGTCGLCSSLQHAAHYQKLQRIEAVAKELVKIPCHCDYCWTSRGGHCPRGCTWEDLEPLREVLGIK
jgi:hypothetical protein